MFSTVPKNNNDNNDKERESIKELTKSIKLANFTEVSMVDLVKPGDALFKDIQEIVLNFYLKGSEYGFKKKIKDIKKLQSTHGLDKLMQVCLEMYDELRSQINEQTEMEDSHIKDLSDVDFEKYFIDTKRFGVLCSYSICLLSIILNNDLFNYDIEYFEEKNNALKIIKSSKRITTHVASGYNNIPYIVNIYDFNYIRGQIQRLGYERMSVLPSISAMINMSNLALKYFYKSKYPKVSNDLYDVNSFEEFCKKNLFNAQYTHSDFICELSTNRFKSRKVLLPSGGVIIRSLGDSTIFESILLNEFETNFGLYLTGIIRYKDESELPINIPLHVRGNYLFVMPDGKNIMASINDFYGIEKSDIKYEIISPYYWKYRGCNYETNNERELRLKGLKVKKEYEIKINSFVRKINGNPSKEALALAKKLFIELEPNTTIVKAHTRTYNKVKKEY